MKNIAVIAHVDHGKTTIVDNLLKLTEKTVHSMDSNALEQERGITILSKCTGIMWKNEKINIVDTPGHSDFGGEVERIMSMVDAALLIVDAVEGIKPQTKFVIDKAVKKNLDIIIVINKMDRDGIRPIDVMLSVLELIHNMGYKKDVESIPVLYASGRDNWVIENAEDTSEEKKDLSLILDYILKVQSPINDNQDKFKMLVSMIERDEFLGRLLIGRIFAGTVKAKQEVKVLNRKGEKIYIGRITKLFTFQGMKRIQVEEASAGDIIAIAGLNRNASATDTICDIDIDIALESDAISPSTLSIVIGVNNSPTSGQDGSQLTSNKIKERLTREVEGNIAIQVKPYTSESFEVFGRGELQLGILIENMRREGFELLVSKPKVVIKEENKIKFEPIEKVYITVDAQYNGFVIEELNNRAGNLISMTEENIEFTVPTRGLMGFHSIFVSQTNGTGLIDREFYGYDTYRGEIKANKHGSLISMENGEATAYALNSLQQRGQLFIAPGDIVYIGMVIGENAKEGDMEVNPVKCKKLTNMRASGKDEAVQLTTPKKRTLEECLNYINDDEALEVTPKIIRIRKYILSANERKKQMT